MIRVGFPYVWSRGTAEEHLESRKRGLGPGADRPEEEEESAILDPAMEDEIARLVKTPLRYLAASASARRFHQTYRWEGRNRSIRHWLSIVATLNLLCAITDIFIVPRADLPELLIGRAAISIAFTLGTLPLSKLRGTLVEGICVIAPCMVLLATTGIVGLSESPLLAERYLVNACLVIASGIVFLRIDSTSISMLTILTCVVMPFFILVSRIEPATAKAEIILFHVGALAALWNAHRIQSLYRYRGIVLSLHNEIQARKMSQMNTELMAATRTDALTGIANRRHFDATRAMIDPQTPVAVLMIDIDHFKVLNDTRGHAEGDRCLRLVAQTIRAEIRAADVAARYGGEEFTVLITNADWDEARSLAERIRASVAMIDKRPGEDLTGAMTVSIGVGRGLAADQDTLLRQADQALYKAKDDGRNRVILARDVAAIASAA